MCTNKEDKNNKLINKNRLNLQTTTKNIPNKMYEKNSSNNNNKRFLGWIAQVPFQM